MDDTGKKCTVGDYELHKQLPRQLMILFNLAVHDGFRKWESAKLPVIPFHGLRHPSATLLTSTTRNIATVAHRLGHTHTSVILDI